jgi:hypothetical protein
MTLRSSDRDAIEAEIERIRSLGLDELRARWRATLRSSPPPAFTKDLTARFLCWLLQEQALGRLNPGTAKLLDRLAQGDKPGMDRRLKPGTVLVREYQGERHTVTVVPCGYEWRESTYPSLSTVARVITGTAWNGRRFFGLGAGRNRPDDVEREYTERPVGTAETHRSGRRATRRTSAILRKAPR